MTQIDKQDWKKELAKLDFYWVTNQHKELVVKVIEQALKAQRQSFIELVEEKKNGKHQLDESYEVLEELLKELRKEK
jgi:hypothetical protein